MPAARCGSRCMRRVPKREPQPRPKPGAGSCSRPGASTHVTVHRPRAEERSEWRQTNPVHWHGIRLSPFARNNQQCRRASVPYTLVEYTGYTLEIYICGQCQISMRTIERWQVGDYAIKRSQIINEIEGFSRSNSKNIDLASRAVLGW